MCTFCIVSLFNWIIGEGEAKTDYCISPDDVVPTPRPTRKPTPRPTMPTGSNKLTKVGNNLGEGMLGRCEGDCDNDRDCFPGLECMKRTDGRLKNGDVPGCKNEGALGTDYCELLLTCMDQIAFSNSVCMLLLTHSCPRTCT